MFVRQQQNDVVDEKSRPVEILENTVPPKRGLCESTIQVYPATQACVMGLQRDEDNRGDETKVASGRQVALIGKISERQP